jgi:MFS transporter, SP family, solute carrier family 2 (myo-inositol transporter), member 13
MDPSIAPLYLYLSSYMYANTHLTISHRLFPLPVRSLGSALATATNWGANFVIGLTFLPLMDALTPTGTFALYTAICIAGYAAVWRIYPETAGLSLEQVGELLRDGWGVRGRQQQQRRQRR